MAMLKQIGFLLMLHFCTSLDQEPSLVFGKQGGDAMFHFPITDEEQENFSFYRTLENETMLLMTVKGNETASQSQRISFSASQAKASFRLNNVSSSESGIYTVETRRGEYRIRSHNCYLAFCSKVTYSDKMLAPHSEHQRFRFDIDGFDPSQGETLEVYKVVKQPQSHFDTLTIGTDVCSQIFPGEPVSELQVSQNGSVWLSSNLTNRHGERYYIIIRKGNECQQLIEIEIRIFSISIEIITKIDSLSPELDGSISESIHPILLFPYLVWPGQRVTLRCVTDHRHNGGNGYRKWETPKRLSFDPFVTIIHSGSKAHKEEMYIETTNYSLVIPSVKSSHSGRYTCHTEDITSIHELNVCLDLESTYVHFSHNDSVALSCNISLTGKTEWYRQRGEEVEMLSGPAVMPENMRERVHISNRHRSLILSNLLPQDSGLYRCLQGTFNAPCFSRRFHLVYRHPYGIDSPFYWVYASLLGSGLLLMICAVVYVNLRIRDGRVHQESPRGKGEPTGEPEREGEQRGDDITI